MEVVPQLISLPAALEDVKINSIPSSAFYIANFITEEEEQVLLNKVSCST
jgi:alkylated DNA repair protein alkB family protein 6